MNPPKSHHESGSWEPHGQRSKAESAFTLDGRPVDPELNQIDRGLEQLASSQAPPQGLSERVYESSVEHLPAPVTLEADFQESAHPARRRSWRTPVLSRLAMAAAVGVAFVVAIWAATESIPTNPQSPEAVLASATQGPNIVLFAKPIGPQESPLTRTGKAVFVLSRDDSSSPVPQLMETDRMSYADLIGDMATIIEEASTPPNEADYQRYEVAGPDLGI